VPCDPDDLDLRVIPPLGAEIYYGHLYDGASQGQLDADTIPRGVFGHYVENIHFPLEGGPPGEYRFYVVRNLGDQSADSWTLRVFAGNTLVATPYSGTGSSITFSYTKSRLTQSPSTSQYPSVTPRPSQNPSASSRPSTSTKPSPSPSNSHAPSRSRDE
jgi:hypothetical protein